MYVMCSVGRTKYFIVSEHSCSKSGCRPDEIPHLFVFSAVFCKKDAQKDLAKIKAFYRTWPFYRTLLNVCCCLLLTNILIRNLTDSNTGETLFPAQRGSFTRLCNDRNLPQLQTK